MSEGESERAGKYFSVVQQTHLKYILFLNVSIFPSEKVLQSDNQHIIAENEIMILWRPNM